MAGLELQQGSKGLDGSSFLGGDMLSESLLGGSFLPKLGKREKPKLWGNYRGSRYLILKEEGAYMTLSKTLAGVGIVVSSCNVSDVSSCPTTKEKICPGNNQCRRIGLRQGPKCSPIKPSEGLLRYPRPL